MAQVMSAFNNARPPIFRFEMRAVEDRAASEAAKHPVMIDQPWVIVHQPGSKDWTDFPAEQWLDQMAQESRFRPKDMPPGWVDSFREDFRKWKAGETLQVRGTPIKGVTFLTPGEIINLTNIQIYSVEDAAAMNQECCQRYGMGGQRVKEKCQTFLATRDSEKAVYELNQLRETCELQKMELEDEKSKRQQLEQRLAALESLIEAQPAKGKRASA